MYSCSPQRAGVREAEKTLEEIKAKIFSKFDENYKSTNLRILINLKWRNKPKENYITVHHNQIAENK